jgi:hypothetical protein
MQLEVGVGNTLVLLVETVVVARVNQPIRAGKGKPIWDEESGFSQPNLSS